VGAFHELTFDYGSRSSRIQAYQQVGAVLFTTSYGVASPNAEPFPALQRLPDLPYKLSFRDIPFSPYQLNTLKDAPDSPWLFFDANANGFVLSAADQFPVARMTLGEDGTLTSGIDAVVTSIPAGFTHQTLLVVGSGVNRLFDTWGNTLTTLRGKQRPPNDADLTLDKFGYWTDNGAVYYTTISSRSSGTPAPC
jgi:hypothetical protein